MKLDFGQLPKFTLSASELRNYCDCPRRRYYTSRDCLGLSSIVLPGNLSFGAAFHALLQYYYTELSKYNKENPGNTVSINAIAPPDLDLSNLTEDYLKILRNSITEYIPQMLDDITKFEVVQCEAPFNLNDYPFVGVKYHGFLDMVLKEKATGNIYFVEHKTCKNFRPEVYNRFDIQLHLYDLYGKRCVPNYCGIFLNQIKKAKTPRGYDHKRDLYVFPDEEINTFEKWLERKTQQIISPDNFHEPCNNFMRCSTCEFAPICLKYGYEVPAKAKEVIDIFKDEQGNPLFHNKPREESEEDR